MAKKTKKKNPANGLIDSLIEDINKIDVDKGTQSLDPFFFVDIESELETPSLPKIQATVDRESSNSAIIINKQIQLNEAKSPNSLKGLSDGILLNKNPHSDNIAQKNNLGADGVLNPGDDKTIALEKLDDPSPKGRLESNHSTIFSEHDKTIPHQGRVASGMHGETAGGSRYGGVYTTPDAPLAQAESLRIAQIRILDLEKQVDRMRMENDDLASAGEIVHSRFDEAVAKISELEQDRKDAKETHQDELRIIKGNLRYKEDELAKSKIKIEDLESRLRSDFRRIRVKERELENRLELVRAEKVALIRAKDENILDLKKKMDHIHNELDGYRSKCADLNKIIEENQESLRKTVRALRLALASLGMTEDDVLNFKKDG